MKIARFASLCLLKYIPESKLAVLVDRFHKPSQLQQRFDLPILIVAVCVAADSFESGSTGLSVCPSYYWPIENENAIDVVSGEDLTSSSPQFNNDRQGQTGSALYIKDASSYWQAPAGNYFGDAFSVTAWIYPYSLGYFSRVLDFGNGESADNLYLTYSTSYDGLSAVGLFNYDQLVLFGKAVSSLVTNQWSHVALVANGTNFKLYINGIFQNELTSSAPMRNIVRENCYFGKSAWAVDSASDLSLDEIRIYQTALSQEQVLNDMNTLTLDQCRSVSGDFYDTNMVHFWPVWNSEAQDLVTGYSLTSQMPTFDLDRFGQTNSALRISNSLNYWSAPADSYFSSTFTITMWFKPVTFSRLARVFDFGNGVSQADENVVLTYSPDGDYPTGPAFKYLLGSNNSQSFYPTVATNLTADTWYHIAVAVQESSGVVYLNGNPITFMNLTRTVNQVTRSYCYFGFSYFFTPSNIYLDEIKIFDIALSQNEVLYDMSSNMTSASSFIELTIECFEASLCQRINGFVLVSSSNDLILNGYCSCSFDTSTNTSYTWSVYTNVGSSTVPIWNQVSSSQSYLSGVETSELTVNSNFFTETDATMFKIQVDIVQTSQSDNVSTNYTTFELFQLNQPPYNGTCSIEPTIGVALSTIFVITCQDWIDNSGSVSKYEYFVMSLSLGFDTAGSFNTTLPSGDSSDSYKLDLRVQVFDSLNCFTTFNISTPVVVYPNSTFLMDVVNDALLGSSDNVFVQALQSNQTSTACSAIISIAMSIDESASQLSSQNKEQVTQLYESLVDKIGSLDPGTSMSDSKSIGSALVSVSANLDLINSQTAINIGAISSRLASNLLSISQGSGLTLVNQVSENLLAAVSNAQQSLNKQYVEYNPSEIEKQSFQLSSAINSTTTVVDQITQVVVRRISVGSTQTTSAKYIDLTVSREYGNKIPEKQVQGDCQVDIPDVCGMLGLSHGSSCSKTTVAQQTYVMPYAIIGSNGNNQINISASKMISQTFYDQNSMNEIQVNNYQSGISFWISKSLDQTPSFNQIDLKNLSQYVNSANQIVSFLATLPSANHSISIDLKPTGTLIPAYFMLVKYDQFPVVNSTHQIYDIHQVVCPHDLKTELNEKFYHLFANMSSNVNMSLKIGYGFRELTSQELQLYCSNQTSVTPSLIPVLDATFDLTKIVSNSLSQRVYFSGCYYLDQSTSDWSSYGTEVLADSNITHTHCISTHLTQFAGGLVIVPTEINFNKVWSNASFTRNMTIYLTVIIISSLYIGLLVWCGIMDRRDDKRSQIFLLKDNFPIDQYFYELIVFTGNRKDAGTDSKVSFILAGSEYETEERELVVLHEESKFNKILQRGSVQSFIMATRENLGEEMRYMRIWHDNSGRRAGWFLKMIVVHDLQTRQKFYFICDDWLAVDRSDGRIERILPVATLTDKSNLAYLMETQTKQSMSENHLWFSIWARPATSSFTRTDRLTCAFVLLCITMLVNIMYYEQASSTSSQTNQLVLGPMTLSSNQVVIGVISNLIIFIPSFLILQIFRKSRRRTNKSSLLKKKLSTVQEIRNHIDQEVEQKNTKIFRNFMLPWWFKIVGYLLSACLIVVCIFFIIVKGISLEDDKCRKWLASFLISIVTSIFLTQPMQVVLLSIFFLLLFKSKRDAHLDPDGELDDGKPFNHFKSNNNKIQNMEKRNYMLSLESQESLMESRAKRRLEKKAWTTIRKSLVYALFLSVLFSVAYTKTNSRSYIYQKLLQGLLLGNISLVNTPNKMWSWIENDFMTGVYGKQWYNGDETGLKKFLNDHSSYLVGVIQLRQARVKSSSCSRILGQKVCHFDYGLMELDDSDYYPGWTLSSSSGSIYVQKAFKYSTSTATDTYPYVGQYNQYLGGGYAVQIDISNSTRSQTYEFLDDLHSNSWIDSRTRALFIEFSVYNVNEDLYCYCTILFEYLSTGNIVTSFDFSPISLSSVDESILSAILGILYMFSVVFLMLNEFKKMIKLAQVYLIQWWSYINWILIIFSWTAFGIYLKRIYEKETLMTKLKSNSNQLINFQTINYWNGLFFGFLGACCFIATLKSIQFLSFSRNVTYLIKVFKKCVIELFGFGVIYLILFLAFCQLMFLMVNDRNVQFKSFSSSLITCFLMLVGKFSVESFEHDAAYILGPLVYSIFTLTMVMLLLNMFISILTCEFEKIRTEFLQVRSDPLALVFYRSKILPHVRSVFESMTSKKKSVKRAGLKYVDRIDMLKPAINRLVQFSSDQKK